MTSFCSQCGNQVRSGGKFCQSCGAPAVQSAPEGAQANPSAGQAAGGAYTPGYPSAQPGGYAGGYPGSYSGQDVAGQAPYGAPPQKSNKLLKGILIAVLVILVLIGGAVAAVTFMVKRAVNEYVQVSDGKDGQPAAVVNIPGLPKISAGGVVSEEQLGLPLYPGATPNQDGGSMTISTPNSEGQGWMGVAVFQTEDSIDEVTSFYNEKLEGANKIESSKDNKHSVIYTLQSQKGWRMVTVARDEDDAKTAIVIASVKGAGEKP